MERIEIFGILLPIAYGLLWLIFQKRGEEWRSAVLSAASVWGISIALSTEILSAFRVLAWGWVLGFWLLMNLLLVILYLKISPIQNLVRENENHQLSGILRGILGGVVAIFAGVALIAIVAPPNTWDSMTYHLSRVVHWMQNHSIEHYPTYYLPQLFHPPWAEFVILHFQFLSGGDRLANLAQWLSMVGSAIAVSLIAQQLGANLQGQVFAAVFAATLPMGILQGSSTQNDYAVCFWVVCFVYFGLAGLSQKLTNIDTFKIGASLGLAILTKTTAYLFVFPFIIWFLWSGVRQYRWKIWQNFAIVAVLVMTLNIGHYWRNYHLFGYAIGAPQEFARQYKVEDFTVTTFLSNIIRNLAMHAGTRISLINGLIMAVINRLHQLLGISTNDPRISWPVGEPFFLPSPSFNENNASNPLHFWLILGTLPLLIKPKDLQKQQPLIYYVSAIISGFMLLCLLIKLQPWHSRHHLTIFVLFAPAIGLALSQIPKQKLTNYLAIILIVMSLPWVVNNKFRPLLGSNNIFSKTRSELYFTNRPQLQAKYEAAAAFIQSQNCSEIGLDLKADNLWEYPLWVLLDRDQPAPRIEHITVRNKILEPMLNSPPYDRFIPCAIVHGSARNRHPPKELVIKGYTYVQKWLDEPLSIFLQDLRK